MRLLIISDSHGRGWKLEGLSELISREGPFDALLHAGDGMEDLRGVPNLPAVYQVRGNCDLFNPFGIPDKLRLPILGKFLFLCHGHQFKVKQTLDLLAKAAREEGASVAVYGHTHRQAVDLVHGVLCINPGAFQKAEYALLEIGKDGRFKTRLKRLP